MKFFKKQDEKIQKIPFASSMAVVDSVTSMGNVKDNSYLYSDIPDALTNENKNMTYYKMSLNSTISSVLNLYSSLLQTIKWSVKSNENKNKEYVALFSDIIHDMEHPWLEFVEHAMTFLQYGWVAFEIVLKKRADGKIGVQKLQYIPQYTLKKWLVDNKGNVTGLVQQGNEFNQFHDVVIPLDKMLMIKNIGGSNSPEGKSILTGAYEDWLTFELSEKSLRTTLTRSFVGMPIITVPADTLNAANASAECSLYTEEEKSVARAAINTYKKMIETMEVSPETGVIMPSDTYRSENGNISNVPCYEMKLMSLNGQPLVDINSVRTNTEARMARVLQGDFLQMGTSSKTGTYSLGSTRYDMFANAVNVVADKIATVINEDLFMILGLFNNIEQNKLPRLHHSKVNETSIKEKIETLAQYQYAGGTILPDENIDMTLKKELDFPLETKRPKGWKPEWEKNENENEQNNNPLSQEEKKTIPDTNKRTRPNGKDMIDKNKK